MELYKPHLPLYNSFNFKSSTFHDWECPQGCVLLKTSGLPCKLDLLILTRQGTWVPSYLKKTKSSLEIRPAVWPKSSQCSPTSYCLSPALGRPRHLNTDSQTVASPGHCHAGSLNRHCSFPVGLALCLQAQTRSFLFQVLWL